MDWKALEKMTGLTREKLEKLSEDVRKVLPCVGRKDQESEGSGAFRSFTRNADSER